MIELNIFVKFFRDFLDGWIYAIYVIICLFFLFLCIKSLFRKGKGSTNTVKSINAGNVVNTTSGYPINEIIPDANVSNHLNASNVSNNSVSSIIQNADDSVFRYSGDIIENNKK